MYRNYLKYGILAHGFARAYCDGCNSWWGSGASHMNQAYPRSNFDRCGLVNLLDQLRRLQSVS